MMMTAATPKLKPKIETEIETEADSDDSASETGIAVNNKALVGDGKEVQQDQEGREADSPCTKAERKADCMAARKAAKKALLAKVLGECLIQIEVGEETHSRIPA